MIISTKIIIGRKYRNMNSKSLLVPLVARYPAISREITHSISGETNQPAVMSNENSVLNPLNEVKLCRIGQKI